MSDENHYEHLEEMEVLEMSIDELREENARLKRQLEKCRFQRNWYVEGFNEDDKQSIVKKFDAEIEEIK